MAKSRDRSDYRREIQVSVAAENVPRREQERRIYRCSSEQASQDVPLRSGHGRVASSSLGAFACRGLSPWVYTAWIGQCAGSAEPPSPKIVEFDPRESHGIDSDRGP